VAFYFLVPAKGRAVPSVANKKTMETAEPFQFSPAEPVDYGKDVYFCATA